MGLKEDIQKASSIEAAGKLLQRAQYLLQRENLSDRTYRKCVRAFDKRTRELQK